MVYCKCKAATCKHVAKAFDRVQKSANETARLAAALERTISPSKWRNDHPSLPLNLVSVQKAVAKRRGKI